jgi:hypothetical protein
MDQDQEQSFGELVWFNTFYQFCEVTALLIMEKRDRAK